MNLNDNATDATETEGFSSEIVENIAETTPKDNMNEPNDMIEISTENEVEALVNTIEIPPIEASIVENLIEENIAEEATEVEFQVEMVELPAAEVLGETIIEDKVEEIQEEINEPILGSIAEIEVLDENIVEDKFEEIAEEINEPIIEPIAGVILEEPISENPVELAHSEVILAEIEVSEEQIPQVALEPIEEVHSHVEVDYSNFTKNDFVDLGEKLLASIKAEKVSMSDIKNADVVMKEIKPMFDDMKAREKSEALKAYIAENGNNEGFDYKNDNFIIRFESLNAQIRDTKNSFFQKLERLKEDYFERKTQLLQRLRVVVETEETNGSKNNWTEFKKIQEEWKTAGNVNSPHNTTLWSAYNALVDRYFSIRNIQNELKDLDRKKNFTTKAEVVAKIETIANNIGEGGLSNTTLRQANDLLEEYKHIGPAAREAQDELWQRLKVAFDLIHNKRREQSSQTNHLQEEIYGAKVRLIENLKPYLEFTTDSINEWNAKTKEVMAIQDQWNSIKGAMPKEKGKDISRDFWAMLKTFFRNKGDFFSKLEAIREENLKVKTSLCEQVETIAASDDYSASYTDKVVELQKTWKTIGHVPEKMKDKIYERFKKACDTFFNGKREKGNVAEKEYEENLKKKIAICEQIETIAQSGEAQLGKLADFKSQYNGVGFVPRKDMQTMQRRFVDAVNAYVKGSTGLSGAEKEKMVLQNEVEAVSRGGEKGSSKELDKKENDIRRKMKTLEDDIHLWENNIEFFARSKNAASVRAEYEGKIKGAEKELAELKQKLKIIIAAN